MQITLVIFKNLYLNLTQKIHCDLYGQLLRRVNWAIRMFCTQIPCSVMWPWTWLLVVNHRCPTSDFSWGEWMAICRLYYLHWIMFLLLSHPCCVRTLISSHVFQSWSVDLSVIWFDQPAQISNTWFLKMGHHLVDWFRITWSLEWGWLSEDACLRGGDQHLLFSQSAEKHFCGLFFGRCSRLCCYWVCSSQLIISLFSLAVFM